MFSQFPCLSFQKYNGFAFAHRHLLSAPSFVQVIYVVAFHGHDIRKLLYTPMRSLSLAQLKVLWDKKVLAIAIATSVVICWRCQERSIPPRAVLMYPLCNAAPPSLSKENVSITELFVNCYYVLGAQRAGGRQQTEIFDRWHFGMFHPSTLFVSGLLTAVFNEM
uniref:Piwi domain-containing protein n=1 Tax=Panagrellus redivivus TaxID=6233 RepID=A0A7E4W4Q4_PANRE